MSDAPPSTLAIVTSGVVALLVAIISAIGAFIAGKGNSDAARFSALTQGFERYKELQDERIVELEGRLSAQEQHLQSLENLLRMHGLPIPTRPAPAEIIFMVPPTKIKGAVHG